MSSWIGCYAVYTSEDDVTTTKSNHSLASQLKAFRASRLQDPSKTEFVYLHHPRCNVSLITGVQRNAGTISLATVSHPFISDLRSVMARSERIVMDMAGDTDKSPIACEYDPRIPVWLAEALSENTNCGSAFPTDRVVHLPLVAPLITTSVQCDTTIPVAAVICILRFSSISGREEDSVGNWQRGSQLFAELPQRVFPLGGNACKSERLRVSANSETLASILGKFIGFSNEENWDALTSYRPVNFGIHNTLDDTIGISAYQHQSLLPFSPKHRDLIVVIESYTEHSNESLIAPTHTATLRQLMEHVIKICAQIVISNCRGELSWRRVDQSRLKLHPSRLACRRVILLINGSIVISESDVGECDAKDCRDISVSTRDVVITDGSVDRLDLSPAAAVIRVTHRTCPPASSAPQAQDISAKRNEKSRTSAHETRNDALVKMRGAYPFDLILKYISSAEVLLALPETALPVSASSFARARGPKASFVGIWPSLGELAADIVPTRSYSGAFAPIVIPMPISKISNTTEQCDNITPKVGESMHAEIAEHMTGISRELDALVKLADIKTNPTKCMVDGSEPSKCTPPPGERSKQRNREELTSLELNMSKVWAVSQLIRPLLDTTDSVRTLNSRIHTASKTSFAEFFNFSTQTSLPRILLLIPSGELSLWCDALAPLLHSVFQREWSKWLVHGGLLASECLEGRQTLNTLLSEWSDAIVSCAPFTTTPFLTNGRRPSDCYFRPPVVFLASEDYWAGGGFSFLYSGTWRPSIMACMRSARNSLLPRTMLHANIGLAPMHFKRHSVDEADEMNDCPLRRTLWEHYVAILQTGADKPFGGYPVPFCNFIRSLVERLIVCCHGIRRAECKSSGRVIGSEITAGHCAQRHQHSEPQPFVPKVTPVGSSLRLANMSCLEWD